MDNKILFSYNNSITTDQINSILKFNDTSKKRNISLTKEEAKDLIISKNFSLKKYERIEFNDNSTKKIMYEFSSSDFINKHSYLQTLEAIIDLFYLLKNESEDKISDDDLILIMKEKYENVCFGDISILGSILYDYIHEII